MKHLTRIAAFVLAITFLAGCGDKKDDPKPVSKLVGTWTVVSSQTVMTVGGKSYKQYLIDELGLSDEDAGEFADLMSELLTLTDFYAEMEIKADGTWTGDSDFVDTPVVGKWELTSDEKTLSLTNNAEPGVTEKATITKLTDTDLWLEMIPTDLPPGTPTNFTYTGVIKCTRKK